MNTKIKKTVDVIFYLCMFGMVMSVPFFSFERNKRVASFNSEETKIDQETVAEVNIQEPEEKLNMSQPIVPVIAPDPKENKIAATPKTQRPTPPSTSSVVQTEVKVNKITFSDFNLSSSSTSVGSKINATVSANNASEANIYLLATKEDGSKKVSFSPEYIGEDGSASFTFALSEPGSWKIQIFAKSPDTGASNSLTVTIQ